MRSKITSLYYLWAVLLLHLALQPSEGQELRANSNDSVFVKSKTLQDSLFLERTKVKPYRPAKIVPSERFLKWQLVRLARMTAQHDLDPFRPTEEMVAEMDVLPDEIKFEMVSLIMAGGVSQQLLRLARRFLMRQGIDFLVPSLSGLSMSYSLPRLPMKINCRLSSFTNQYYSASTLGLFTFSYLETTEQMQRGIAFNAFKGVSLMSYRIITRWDDFLAFGFSRYSKPMQLYFLYQKSAHYTKGDYAVVEFRLVLD
jgi:hypothetical protein